MSKVHKPYNNSEINKMLRDVELLQIEERADLSFLLDSLPASSIAEIIKVMEKVIRGKR